MSSSTAPRVEPLVWQERAEELVQWRACYLHLANDQDPENKFTAQQAQALVGPLVDIEDAIFHMDEYYGPGVSLFLLHEDTGHP